MSIQSASQDNFFELGGHSFAVPFRSSLESGEPSTWTCRSAEYFRASPNRRTCAGSGESQGRGLKARMPPLIRRPPLSPKDALISQLDQLSPEEIRALLDNVIARRPSAAGA